MLGSQPDLYLGDNKAPFSDAIQQSKTLVMALTGHANDQSLAPLSTLPFKYAEFSLRNTQAHDDELPAKGPTA